MLVAPLAACGGPRLRFASLLVLGLLMVARTASAGGAEPPPKGARIYAAQCAECHGTRGEGVADVYEEPLSGDLSVAELARVINDTMPEEEPEQCTGDDARQVAEYIYDAFYSHEARARNQVARVELSRLTVRQYLETAADLVGSFRDRGRRGEERGLRGSYYASRNFRGDQKKFDRRDPKIDFSFGSGSPDTDQIGSEEFSMRWRGAVIAEQTGDYEFCLKTENGARLWINDPARPLIDAWVSSGGEITEHRETIRLLGGRAYPLKLDYFKFKGNSASLQLLWKPPRKTWQVVPASRLVPDEVPPTLVVTTAFPPDDGSAGYERGVAVSAAWDQAATNAAIEVAEHVVRELDSLARCRPDDPQRPRKVREFCHRFAERAFRRPLTDDQKQFFVDQQFDSAGNPEDAVKRVVLLVLKSPRFLYLGLGPHDAYAVASRLSYSLWDSLPDEPLLEAARDDRLQTPEQVADQARRMLQDERTAAKLRAFFAHWLLLEEADDVAKDAQLFPEFDQQVVSDLRTSLELFLDEVVWSEQSDFRQLLLADYLFVNRRLAEFYGLEVPAEDGFHKVSVDPQTRAGVVTHPLLLSVFAYHKSSSPIHRGVFVTRRLLSRALKPPPMAIEFMDGRFGPDLTMREKVAELTKPAACQTCHRIINPLGFSLEHYDAVGRYRTQDNGRPVDSVSDYPAVDGGAVRLSGARDLARYAAGNDDAHRGFVEQLFHHLVKQPAAAYGPDTLDELTRDFAASNYHVQKLLVKIATRASQHHPPATHE